VAEKFTWNSTPTAFVGSARWGKVWLPRVGRWITIQGDVVGTYEVNNRPSLCVVMQDFATGDSICPVTALEQLFLVDARPDAPLFRFINRGFRRQDVINRIKSLLALAGVDPGGYRHRAATTLVIAGQGLIAGRQRI
jgi:hypothetical protein